MGLRRCTGVSRLEIQAAGEGRAAPAAGEGVVYKWAFPQGHGGGLPDRRWLFKIKLTLNVQSIPILPSHLIIKCGASFTFTSYELKTLHMCKHVNIYTVDL